MSNDRTFNLVPGRRYIHVAEVMSNGQRTARWSYDTQTTMWRMSEGWKRPGRFINPSQGQEIEALLAAQGLSVR